MSERAKYFFGPDPAAPQFGCGFSGDGGDSHCTAESTWHGLAIDAKPDQHVTNLLACDDHYEAMARLADFVHALDTACGVGEPWWRWATGESGCAVDWDAAQALLLAAEAIGAGA